MVFSGLRGLPTSRSSSRGSFSVEARRNSNASTLDATAVRPSGHGPSHTAPPSPDFISDETHLQPLDPETPDLRELNNSLQALADVFPDVQADVFREMLSSFDGESRLALVADALLKNKATWVKGRWRVAEKPPAADRVEEPLGLRRRRGSSVRSSELFRSPGYKLAVKALAWHDFKGLSRSTINAVLAEFNYSYLDARPTLAELSSKSWSFAISSIFLRRKAASPSDAENHPLVVWKSTGRGSIVPGLKTTGNPELDRELFHRLVAPLRERARLSQVEGDRSLAISLNAKEAEELDDTHDCACCFSSAPFEQLTSCSANGHLICFSCVQHSIDEAVFGQGWRNIDAESGTLCCPGVDEEECKGRILSDDIQRAMLDDKRGADILSKLDQRLAEHSLVASGLPLTRCPFCAYAEVDDVGFPVSASDLRLRVDNMHNVVLSAVFIGTIAFLMPLVAFSLLAAVLISSRRTMSGSLWGQFHAAVVRHRRRRRGLRFSCQAPGCGRSSCLSCHKGWVDVHICHESALVALRTQVEQAMSMAIKRVCPRCNTSFVKTAGCNKLTCPCGYKMCYVCRKDIGGGDDPDGPDVGYRHFCPHFRPSGEPRPCDQCNKCSLWESEDTAAVAERARAEAERKWRAAEDRDLSAAEKAYLETGGVRRSRPVHDVLLSGRVPAVPEVLDILMESLFVT